MGEGKNNSNKAGTARQILARNPGVLLYPSQFPYVGYKVGSEPGVLSLNWLLQRQDGRWFVVSLLANDQRQALNEEALQGLATSLIQQTSVLP